MKVTLKKHTAKACQLHLSGYFSSFMQTFVFGFAIIYLNVMSVTENLEQLYPVKLEISETSYNTVFLFVKYSTNDF